MTITCRTIKLVQKRSSRKHITLTRVYQLKYLGYLKPDWLWLQLMPLVAHPVRSLWGSQAPRCARCVCEWLHRKWDGAIVVIVVSAVTVDVDGEGTGELYGVLVVSASMHDGDGDGELTRELSLGNRTPPDSSSSVADFPSSESPGKEIKSSLEEVPNNFQ